MGDDREAVVDYGEALRQADPLNHATLAEIHDDRGLAQLRLQNYRGAIADFNQAIQLNPADLRAYFNRGCTHHREGHYAAALIDFDQVLQIAPDYAEAAVSRGLVRHQLGQKGEAIADLQHAANCFRHQGAAVAYRQTLDLIHTLRSSNSTIG